MGFTSKAARRLGEFSARTPARGPAQKAAPSGLLPVTGSTPGTRAVMLRQSELLAPPPATRTCRTSAEPAPLSNSKQSRIEKATPSRMQRVRWERRGRRVRATNEPPAGGGGEGGGSAAR